MRRTKQSRCTESPDKRDREPSTNSSQRGVARRVRNVKYIRVEVLKSSRSSASSRRSPTPPPRKVKNVKVGISRTRSAAKRSDSSDPNSNHHSSRSKDVIVKVWGKKAANGAGSSARDSDFSPTDVNHEVPGSKADKDTDSIARDSAFSPTDVNAEVLEGKLAKNASNGARDPGLSPTTVNEEVSGKKTAKNAGSRARDSEFSSANVNAEVFGRKAAASAGGGARDFAFSPTNVNPEVPGTNADKGTDNSTRDFAPSPIGVNAEVAGRKAAKRAESSARGCAFSPTNVKDVGIEAPGRKVTAITATMASMKVSTPTVQISVHKPARSLWSRLWSGLSMLKASQGSWRDGALQDLKAPVIDSSGLLVSNQKSSICADKPAKQGSPALQEKLESSESSAASDISSVTSEANIPEPAAKRRKVFTSDSKNQFEVGCSRDEPQRTAQHIDVERESQTHVFNRQTETKCAAVARIAVNSHKQLKCRSYLVCKHLREATNDIGLSIFCSYPEDRTLCLSLYGMSFIIALTKPYLRDVKLQRETLRCGAMTLNKDGRMAYSCKEVVTTFRRRQTETYESSVITETYLRRSATVNQQAEYGIASSAKNITSHILTADLKTSVEQPAHGVWKELLFNTACFDNLWRCPFNKHSTYMGCFLSNWTDKVMVPVMRRTSVFPYSFYPDRQVDVVCIPYADDVVCLTLIVQRSPSLGNLSVLTPADVKGFVHGARNRLVTLHLPKFRLSTSIDVADLMNRIACAYSTERRVKFLHAELETSIAIDEGNWLVTCTEPTSSAGDPVTVVIDRPFHFVITDNTSDLILYVGRMMSLP